MGCVSSKPKAVEDGGRSPRQRVPSRRLSRTTSSSREGGHQMMNRSDSRTSLIDRKTSSSIRLCEDRSEKSRVKPEDVLVNQQDIRMVPKAREGEHVAAGWPSWLAVAAGEAVTGWIPRRADSFERLDKIGEGTYSSVYKARDLIHGKLVALKKVRFDNLDQESVKFMSREILILRRLDHPNIIKLEGLIASSTSSSLYLIFEYMEHDLTGIASVPGMKFTEPQVKCFMQQLLCGLEYCHSHGVLHRDIKGSNLLIDDSGILKIADFGLATFFDPQKSLPLTSRVVTLWYRPPELLLGATRYGVSVDLWSAGCILGELYAGKPIMPGRTEVEQLHKIFKLCGSPPEEYWEKSKLPHSTAFKPQRPYRGRVAERFPDISAPALALIETPQSEVFKSRQGESTSGSLSGPLGKPEAVKEVSKEIFNRLHQRGVYSGTLSRGGRGTGWSNGERKLNDPPSFSRLPNLTNMVPKRTSAAEVNHLRRGLSQNRMAADAAERYSGPLNDLDGRNEDWLHYSGSMLGSHQLEEPMRARRPVHSLAPDGDRLHLSGPLLHPSRDLDQMLKDHDRRIQDAARRARSDKFKHSKLLVR
ncbi:hypothetical protein RDABS01_021242 [Bienertia sinuspersici]